MTDRLYEGHIAREGQGPVNPYVAPDTTPDRADAGPDLVLDAQRTYMRAIQDTGWATTVQWTPGAAVSTTTLLSYLRLAGYPETVAVDADTATGTVTITTTHPTAEASTTDWSAFDGTTGQAIVETGIAWVYANAAAAHPVPRLEHLISMWGWLERSGYPPVSLYRRTNLAAGGYEIIIRTYGETPVNFAYGFPHQAVSEEEAARGWRVQAKTNPPTDSEGLALTLQPTGGLEVETGMDFRQFQTVEDALVVTAPTSSIPVVAQQTQPSSVVVAPAYFFGHATDPPGAREGDLWYTLENTLKRLIKGVWTTITGSDVTNEGSVIIGRLAAAFRTFGTVVGYEAQTDGQGQYGTALGYKSIVTGTQGTAVGASAKARAFRSTAVGGQALADADNSIAIGAFAVVPATSPRAGAEGYGATAPDNIPDRKTSRFNEIRQERSNGTGRTAYILTSPDGTDGRITVTDGDGVLVNDRPVAKPSAGYIVPAHVYTAAGVHHLAQDITGMAFAVGYGEAWTAEFHLNVGCSGAGGVRLALSLPTLIQTYPFRCLADGDGATLDTIRRGQTYLAGEFFSADGGGVTVVNWHTRATTDGVIHVYLSINPGGVQAGIVQLRFASAVAGQQSVVYSGSYFDARKVG